MAFGLSVSDRQLFVTLDGATTAGAVERLRISYD